MGRTFPFDSMAPVPNAFRVCIACVRPSDAGIDYLRFFVRIERDKKNKSLADVTRPSIQSF